MKGYINKRVLISGGSKGIGRALAVQLASAGAHVVVTARGQAALDETVEAMRGCAAADRVLDSISMDVTDSEAVAKGCAEAIERLEADLKAL